MNELTYRIRGAAFNVHTQLGPGLLESIYELCLAHELKKDGLSVERQKALPVTYDGLELGTGYRMDLLVENKVVLELKAVKQLTPLDQAQLLTLYAPKWGEDRLTAQLSRSPHERRNTAIHNLKRGRTSKLAPSTSVSLRPIKSAPG